jgi:hypothetical protein
MVVASANNPISDGGGGNGGGGGGIGNFGSGGSSNNNKPTEYKITKEAYEALLEKWNYADGRIPLVSFEDKNYNGTLIINFITENFEPFFELEGQQLKDTTALVLLKFLLNLPKEESFKKETIKAINIFATVTRNQINYEDGNTVFSIGKNNKSSYYFLQDQALIDLEVKSILENNEKNAFYYPFYKFLVANLNNEDILTRLDYFYKSETLNRKLPEFVIEIGNIKERIKEQKTSLKYVVFGAMAREEKFPNINCVFNPILFKTEIQDGIKESPPQTFIQDIKDTIINLMNKVKQLSKNKNNNHLVSLFNKMLVYYNILSDLGLYLPSETLEIKISPITTISSDNILLGLDSTEILAIFAEVLKINGENTENIPKIVDYYLKILCSSFFRELAGDINETFKKFNNLPITQIPYLEDEIILMRRGIQENPEIDKNNVLSYLTFLESQLTEYKTFVQTNINASNTKLAKLLTDAIKEDKNSIEKNNEPTAFKETFEKIARLLFLKSLGKNKIIDVNSVAFQKPFQKIKPFTIAEILTNENVQQYLSEIIKEIEKDEVRKWHLKQIELVKSTKWRLDKENKIVVEDGEKWYLKLTKTIKQRIPTTPDGTRISLHTATILSGRKIPALEDNPHSR